VTIRRLLPAISLALLLVSCGLAPSPNASTPPEILVTASGGASVGATDGYSVPFGAAPGTISSQSLPAGVSLWGATDADNTLILLAQTGAGLGQFLLSPLPLSSAASPAVVTGLSGTPYALAQSGQEIVVLETTSSSPQGCLEVFSSKELLSLSSSGGQTSSRNGCVALTSSGATLSGGFLLPLADGIGCLVGTVSGGSTRILLYPLTTVLGGGSLASPQSIWSLPHSLSGGVPLSAVALSSVILLPDPVSAAVDIYKVTTLYNGGGGAISPLLIAGLSLPGAPTLLATDPAQNFLIAASGGTVSLFGLNSVLNPPGTVGSLGTIAPASGLSLGAMALYTGSS